MTEKEFYEMIRDRIRDYLPERYENCRVELNEVVKNNDLHLTGISVIPEGENAAPLVYLNSYYHQNREGRDADDICREIADTFLSFRDMSEQVNSLDMNYESMKDKLRVKVVNTKTNRELLRNVISQPVGCGYALVPYIDLENSGFPGGYVQITKELASSFEKSSSEIIEEAVKGSCREEGAGLFRIEDMLFGIGKPENLLKVDIKEEGTGPFVLTNTSGGVLGACALFLPNVQKQIADTLGSGYYVMPSSIHEVLIMSDRSDMSPRDLVNMVKEVNSTMVAPEEQLGSRVLHYNAMQGRLSIAADLDRSRGTER